MGLNKQTLLNLQDKKQVKKGNFSTNRKQTTRK
jgi:predicted house-cleaning noncanonical NTP pyrophosphatase (MazG superfamily)